MSIGWRIKGLGEHLENIEDAIDERWRKFRNLWTHEEELREIESLKELQKHQNLEFKWIHAGLVSGNQEWIEVIKRELESSTRELNTLNYFSRRLRDSFFNAAPKYSLDWWLQETGVIEKRVSVFQMWEDAFKECRNTFS